MHDKVDVRFVISPQPAAFTVEGLDSLSEVFVCASPGHTFTIVSLSLQIKTMIVLSSRKGFVKQRFIRLAHVLDLRNVF